MSDREQNEYRARAEQAASTAAAPAPKPASPWIMGAGLDLLLFVATPLLILPAFLFARTKMSLNEIALIVAAFGALGHHLPGMIRAYGDRALYREYRMRFIVAPIFLLLVCLLCTLYEYDGITFIVYAWGLWHGLMQTYGFVRIYDAKRGSFAKATQKLDFQMCFWWFMCGLFLSPSRFFMMVEIWHVKCGGPMPGAVVLDALRWGVAGITALVTLAFLANHLRLVRAGHAPSPIKLVLMATSFAFWMVANIAFTNILVGVVLFEVFHDVQYLAIVWVFNRARVEKDPGVGAFTRFLFRRSGALVGVYVGLVFAYGSLRIFERQVPDQFLKDALTGILAASGLLHFYYDGFIWKIRQKKTSDALGVAGSGREGGFGALPGWALHGAKWAIFALPLALLVATEAAARSSAEGEGASNFKRLRGLVERMPENAFVHEELGKAYRQFALENDDPALFDRSIEHFRRAADLGIGSSETWFYLGVLLADRGGDYDAALAALDRAIELEPVSDAAWARRGRTLLALGRGADARAAFDRALAIDEENAVARHGMAAVAAASGDAEGAIAAYAQAADFFASARAERVEPELASQFGLRMYERGDDRGRNRAYELEEARTRHELAQLMAERGDVDAAILEYERAVELRPSAVNTWFNLGAAYARQGRLDEAASAFRAVLERKPDHAAARAALDQVEAAAG